MPAIIGIQNRAASCSQDDTLALRQIIDHCPFPFAETLLAFDIEYPGDIGPCPPLNLMITVEKLTSEVTSQLSPDRCFTCTHQADQEYIAFIHG